ncbi:MULTISPECIES: mechanosensitive ion channel family protein [unclassified Tenacibaculum]|uniref:mechanosensitive ion channel family protein n=1 Tax=Tenacibaculum TaxID=104267 RepID=UPI000894C249|nr:MULTISPECIES: mechanosensitive ion channel domain-containing protein [unclassified Tenacibaculum]RBW55691.1 mechanosensitive ion channel family protein [Tenacibaculum sp. E3R01]SEE60682.1 miniconductance mechanosensitive channel [Tenacibaculum sp. MAR_2010_89]
MSLNKHLFYNYLQELGFSINTSKYLNLFILLILFLIAIYVIDIITRKVFQSISVRIAKTSKTNFDDILLANKLPTNIAHLIPVFLFFELIPILFYDFEYIRNLIIKSVQIISIVLVIKIVRSILNSIKDYLKTLPKFKDKPIDSYIQVFMIFAWFSGFILSFAIITNQSILAFFTALGAASAIIILIFKDTILGFVASIQVSVNDMVRIGDWITFEKFGADGDVIEISLATVKVQNFDKTITTIPTYALISDSFKNWRGMVNSQGRRIKRALNIKINSIKHLSNEDIDKLKSVQLIEEYLTMRQKKINNFNKEYNINKGLLLNGRNLTNIGVFRKYAQTYIEMHPAINNDMMIMVRQLAPTSQGLPLEIYAFSADKNWKNYEYIVSDIFDHLLASIKHFDLEIFELPTNTNF